MRNDFVKIQVGAHPSPLILLRGGVVDCPLLETALDPISQLMSKYFSFYSVKTTKLIGCLNVVFLFQRLNVCFCLILQ